MFWRNAHYRNTYVIREVKVPVANGFSQFCTHCVSRPVSDFICLSTTYRKDFISQCVT